ncbi:hypothetical protein B0H11DRAFT_2220655 [Mycena galericulata]|nr:hypothetical protein B0H11DRAFT_2220655 [Mycena galericulata]
MNVSSVTLYTARWSRTVIQVRFQIAIPLYPLLTRCIAPCPGFRAPVPHPTAKASRPRSDAKSSQRKMTSTSSPPKREVASAPTPIVHECSASTSNAGPKFAAAVMPRPAAAAPDRTQRECAARLHRAQALRRPPSRVPSAVGKRTASGSGSLATTTAAAPDVLTHLHKRLTTLESARTQDAERLSTLLESQAASYTGGSKALEVIDGAAGT